MRLEDVSAQLRPRGAWEAVDLGFALTRRHFPLLISAWLLTVVPLWGALLLLSKWLPLGFVMLLLWWLKPIYDRVPLFILSRALFGAVPRLRDVLRAWPGMLWRRLGRLLLLSRLSLSRSLVLPVVDLEGMKGRGYTQRARVLTQRAGGTAGALIFLAVLYEFALIFGLFSFFGMMVSPDGGATETWEAFVDSAFRHGEMSPWLLWSLIGGYLASMTLVELFYVGGGFGLYLDCRTHLEGWDVEIAFKRLVRRVTKIAALMFAFVLLPTAQAQLEKSRNPDADATAQRTIEEVLKHRDFEIHKIKRKVPADKNRSSMNAPLWFQHVGTVLFYLLIAVAVAAVVWLIYVNRHLFQRGARSPAKAIARAGPRTVMGFDLSPDSLPADIVAAAWERWRAGDARGALSLLYRGSLSWLVHTARLPVNDSDTEGDCLRKARVLAEPVRQDYFAALTSQWVQAAYAERAPEAAEMERLLQNWPFTAGGQPA